MYNDANDPSWAKDIDFDAFQRDVETKTVNSDCPTAITIECNIPVYDGSTVSEQTGKEWT